MTPLGGARPNPAGFSEARHGSAAPPGGRREPSQRGELPHDRPDPVGRLVPQSGDHAFAHACLHGMGDENLGGRRRVRV